MGLAILGDLMLGRHQAPLINEHGIEGILGDIKETLGKRKNNCKFRVSAHKSQQNKKERK